MARRRYYKAIRPDGGSFHNPDFKWATEPGGITTHPDFRKGSSASGYLSVSTVPTDCTGMVWPCRLLLVEPVGRTFVPDSTGLPNKRAASTFRTVAELPAHEALGPQGEAVVALIARARTLTSVEADQVSAAEYAAESAARDAARDAAWYAAESAARDTARDAAWYAAESAARDAAEDAARALTLRDLVGTGEWTQEAYETLVGPWVSVIGKVHPDD